MVDATRRRLLTGVAVATVASVAGCGGDGAGTPTNNGQAEETPTATTEDSTATEPTDTPGTPEPTPEPTSGGTESAPSSSGTPAERAVRGYVDGFDAGDRASANEHLHPDSPLYRDQELGGRDIEIHEIEAVPLETAVERDTDADESPSEIRDEIETLTESIGADDWATVWSDTTFEAAGREEVGLVVVRVEGDWLIWGSLVTVMHVDA